MTTAWLQFTPETLTSIPALGGVYMLLEDGLVIRVGMTTRFHARIPSGYFPYKDKRDKTSRTFIYPTTGKITIAVLPIGDVLAAALVELRLIKLFQPRHNVVRL